MLTSKSKAKMPATQNKQKARTKSWKMPLRRVNQSSAKRRGDAREEESTKSLLKTILDIADLSHIVG